MTLDHQLPTIEQSKRFRELGWDTFSDYAWFIPEPNADLGLTGVPYVMQWSKTPKGTWPETTIPAPTIAEMGEWLAENGFVDFKEKK